MSVKDFIILGTSSQQPTRSRNHGAYLLRWNGEGFLFDPGEGTQRQFIFAGTPPPTVTRIFISHFHGDHCLGLGSMLMRLNLDKVTHPIHCYYPASGKKYFHRLRFGTIYHETIEVIEHPIEGEGLVHSDDKFSIYAAKLEHGVDNLAYRIQEHDRVKFDKEKLALSGIKGPLVSELEKQKELIVEGKKILLSEVSHVRKGESVAYVVDTKMCNQAIHIAKDAAVLICESTYSDEHKLLAEKNHHLTASQAATIAKKAGVKLLILTHFSARYLKLTPLLEEAKRIFPNTVLAEDLKVIPFPKNKDDVI